MPLGVRPSLVLEVFFVFMTGRKTHLMPLLPARLPFALLASVIRALASKAPQSLALERGFWRPSRSLDATGRLNSISCNLKSGNSETASPEPL